jgi:hypothetical protein
MLGRGLVFSGMALLPILTSWVSLANPPNTNLLLLRA